jgi:hypothetical protein
MEDKLATLLKDLHIARIVVAENRAEMRRLAAEFEASEGYRALQEKANKSANIIEITVAEINDISLSAFEMDGNKNPWPVIAIKEFDVVTIPNDAAAREWCFTNFRPALKLDTRAFEKAAKDGNVPAELATVTKEPRVQIASDLSKYLLA